MRKRGGYIDRETDRGGGGGGGDQAPWCVRPTEGADWFPGDQIVSHRS
jgi:hypothetical protein